VADRAAEGWGEPDSGMWEARDAERHSTTSKLMCWVALDRAIGLIARWAAEPAGFVLSSYWLADCLARVGETDRARAVFDRVTGAANDLGLLAEMIDPATGAQLGNFPQALSHVGLVNAALSIEAAAGG
jgi:GH15 family glucan-1,4-alpha-glucosidase